MRESMIESEFSLLSAYGERLHETSGARIDDGDGILGDGLSGAGTLKRIAGIKGEEPEGRPVDGEGGSGIGADARADRRPIQELTGSRFESADAGSTEMPAIQIVPPDQDKGVLGDVVHCDGAEAGAGQERARHACTGRLHGTDR